MNTSLEVPDMKDTGWTVGYSSGRIHAMDDTELRVALCEFYFEARRAGVPLSACEEEFIDQAVTGELELSRRQRRIAREILERFCRQGAATG